VIWAMTTRVDATRDTTARRQHADRLPRLRFAGGWPRFSKMGLDATNKWAGETTREWGTPIVMDDGGEKARRYAMWDELGLS
jgi:4-hydroxy-3-polyprenylbenzoate decarboxylase